MSFRAGVANGMWAAGCLPSFRRFRRALADPRAAQDARLNALLRANAGTAYGFQHRFDSINDYASFAASVPLIGYDELEPWVARIRQGEPAVLTRGPVRRLVPTGGSSGSCKLIPFTDELHREFNAAIGPWMVDLFRRSPRLAAGKAYWSITPLAEQTASTASVIPIGFDEDAAYLGGVRRRLVDAIMAVPATVKQAGDVTGFRRATLVHLLRARDLRLISVWHPSFLTLLLDELIASWDELIARVDSWRRSELERADPLRPESVWPRLELVSCWADGHAALAARDLQRRLRGVAVQPKGLLATEGCVTIPFAGMHPLAVCSHFFEFLRSDGAIARAHELDRGETCELVVTTGGGLWRYRLGDRVRVDGFVDRTPSLRFLERTGGVSDRRGEKLSEGFVARVLRELFAAREAPRFALLAPEEDGSGCRYVFFVEGDVKGLDACDLDTLLGANPQYAWCRKLGQLGAPRIVPLGRDGYATFAAHEVARGRRLGDIKPVALSPDTGWAARFGPTERRAAVGAQNRI